MNKIDKTLLKDAAYNTWAALYEILKKDLDALNATTTLSVQRSHLKPLSSHLITAMKTVNNNDYDLDGILVVVGDHFNYIFSRKMKGNEKTHGKGSLVDLVDAAIESGDRTSAEAYLSIDAGHGTITSGWQIDCALQFWKEGTCLFSNESNCFKVSGSDLESCSLTWNGSVWEVYESSMK